MRAKGTIYQVGESRNGVNARGENWQVTTLRLRIPSGSVGANGDVREEEILADYWGDAPRERLEEWKRQGTVFNFTLWFRLHDWNGRDYQDCKILEMALTV